MTYCTSGWHEIPDSRDGEPPPEENGVNKTAPLALEASGSAHLEQRAHEQAEVVCRGRDQVALPPASFAELEHDRDGQAHRDECQAG